MRWYTKARYRAVAYCVVMVVAWYALWATFCLVFLGTWP